MKIIRYVSPTIKGYEKAIKVIDSCKSIIQLNVAKEYCKLYFKQIDSMIKLFPQGSSYAIYYDLQEKLTQKEKELL